MLPLRRMIPKTKSDIFAFVFSLFGIHFILLFELFVTLPSLISQPDYSRFWVYLHLTLGLFIYVSVMSCFWKVISIETSTQGVMLPTFLKPDWKFCYVCECNVPPRSYHCHICERCILKRDHHCTFTGNCIGFRNQRYYLTLLFYTSLATVYANIMNTGHMWVVMNGSLLYLPKLIFPFFIWVLRFITFTEMLTAGSLLFCIGSMIGFCALFAYHLRNLFRGQLTHENSHKIHKYNLGVKENLKAVFGERWAVAWLLPWIPSNLPGDGLSFPIASEYEDPKQM